MTVQTNTNVASFNGNGVTQIFPIAFKFNNDTDLVVLLVDDAAGTSIRLTLNSDYTVSGEGDEQGGLINVVTAPATGKRLLVSRIVDILQLLDLRNQGKFFAEVHEDAFDLLTMIAQQHESSLKLALRVEDSDPEPARIPPASSRAGKLLAFDGNGNPTTALPVADSSTELRQELALGTPGVVNSAAVSYNGASLDVLLSNVSGLSYKAFPTSIARSLGSLFSQVVNVADFADLSVAGGINDAFVKAQAVLTRPGKIIVPMGFYTANATIFLRTDIPVTVEGAGMYSTVIACAAEMSGLPLFKSDAAVVDNHHLLGMTILGNGHAAFGYQCEHLIHGSLKDVMIQGTTVAGIRASDGYNNYFEKLQIFSNFGSGLDISGINNNNVNLNDCNIYANDGVGVQLANGWGITLNGCSIEGNKKAGLMAWDLRGLTINGGYFERNAADGYAYTTAGGSPENLTVKADIHLLSGGRFIGITDGQNVKGAVISGVSFTPYGAFNVPVAGLSQDCVVFATDLENVRITNCDIVDPSGHVVAMVGLYNNWTKCKCVSLRLEQNTLNNVAYLGTGLSAFSFSTGHNIENSFEGMAFNYASQLRSAYAAISGTSGVLSDSTQKYGTIAAWDASVGNRLYGYNIDLTVNPELRGKYVWFGVAYRTQDSDGGLQVYLGGSTDNDGSIIDPISTAGVWRFKSVTKYVAPSDTTLTIGFRRLGSGAQPVVIAAPTLSIVGVGIAGTNRRR